MNKELLDLARRIIWFEKPEEALKNEVHFLNYLMNNGTLEDIDIARKYYKEEQFRNALENAIVGVFNVRRWNFWHIVLGYEETPLLPIRKIFTEEELKAMPKWKANL